MAKTPCSQACMQGSYRVFHNGLLGFVQGVLTIADMVQYTMCTRIEDSGSMLRAHGVDCGPVVAFALLMV